MANASIGGLVSGLDTATIISQLMQLEAQPQTMLKTRVSAEQKAVTSLQALNAKLAAIADQGRRPGQGRELVAAKATSDNDKVTVTACPGAAPTSLSFTVDKTAVAAADTLRHDRRHGDRPGTRARQHHRHAITDADGTVIDTQHRGRHRCRASRMRSTIRARVPACARRWSVAGTDGAYADLPASRRLDGHRGPAHRGRSHRIDHRQRAAFLGQAPRRHRPARTPRSRVGRRPSIYVAAPTRSPDLMPGVDVTLPAGATGASATITVARDTQALSDKVKATGRRGQRRARRHRHPRPPTTPPTKKSRARSPATPRCATCATSSLATVTGGVGRAVACAVRRDPDRPLRQARLRRGRSSRPPTQADPTATRGEVRRRTAPAGSCGRPGDGRPSGSATPRRHASPTRSRAAPRRSTACRTTSPTGTSAWTSSARALERQYGALEVALGKLQSQSTWLAGQISSLPKMGG